MTTLLVTYSGDASTRFDRRHWIEVHLPLVREVWSPHGLLGVSGFFPAGDGGGLIAVSTCMFRDEAALAAALASADTERMMADVATVTDVEPTRSRVVPLQARDALQEQERLEPA